MASQLAEFEAIVLGNLSHVNATRAAAEAALTQMRSSQPAVFMLGLLALLRESQQQIAREFAAVILRQNLLVNSSSRVWEACTLEVRAQIQQGLLFLYQHEQSPVLRRKITDAVAATATRISGKKVVGDALTTDERGVARTRQALEEPEVLTPWPELMPTVLQIAQTNAPQTRQSLCDLIDKLAEFQPQMLQAHLAACKAIIVGGMKDANMDTRLSGLRACVSLLHDLDEAQREHMKDCVPLMFGILETAFNAGDNDTIVNAVLALTNLVELRDDDETETGVAGGAKFLRGHIKPILGAMGQMAASPKLDAETRRACLSFLVVLAEVGKGMIRKQNEFAASVIPLAFSFVTELQHTADWDSPEKVDEGDDDDGFDNYKLGTEAIERLSHALGGKLFAGVATPLIERALKDANWSVRHAALRTLAKMAMGCQKQIHPQLKYIMNTFVIPFAMNDPHYRVRWAAIDLVAYLAQAFEPEFSNTFSAQIFDVLLLCMAPSNHWRVIANACLAMPDICREMDRALILPHMERFLSALVPLLGMLQYRKVVESALAAVSTIAAKAEMDFIPYFDLFMPGVKGLIAQCTQPQQKTIRVKAIECIGMLCQAVGAEKVRPELALVMEALLAMLATDLPSDDPQHAEIVTTMARICRAVKEEFVPYLPRIMPALLKSARIDDACVIVNEGDVNPYENRAGYVTANVETRAMGKKQISRNTSLLEEKACAIRMLFEYSNTLGGAFYPYAKDTADIIVPSVRYQFNPNVRENAVFTLPALMKCIRDGATATANAQAATQQCGQFLEFLWPQVIEAMKVESDLECLGDIVASLREVIEHATPLLVLPASHIDEINQLIYRLVGELLVRCRARDEHAQTEDYDEAQGELFQMENEAEEEFLSNIYALVNALVKNAREAYLVNFHQHLYEIFSAMMKSEDVVLRTNAVCVISQVMEDCPSHALSAEYCTPLYIVCTASIDADDVGLRQCAVFGIGVCAMIMKEKFLGEGEKTLAMLDALVNQPCEPDAMVVTDNAISAMAKIFLHAYNGGANGNTPKKVADLMTGWVRYLPCEDDELEAQKIHEMLTQFVATNNAIVLGEGFSNLPIVLGIFAKILGRAEWEAICLPETRQRMIAIFQQLQQQMPQDQLRAMLHAMNPEQKAAFQPFVLNQALLQ